MPLRSCRTNPPGIVVLRVISGLMLAVAILTAIVGVAQRLVQCFRPGLIQWPVKSSVPLICAGVAFGFFQFAARRTGRQIVLGLGVSLAFILWGGEQFISDPSIVSFIDDVVVLLFVVDLGVVMAAHLRSRPRPSDAPTPPEMP